MKELHSSIRLLFDDDGRPISSRDCRSGGADGGGVLGEYVGEMVYEAVEGWEVEVQR